MSFKSQNFNVLNPELLIYWIPKSLNKSNSFLGIIRAVKKKEVDLEIPSFNLLDCRPFVDFLTILENRLNLYDDLSFFANQEVSVGFCSIDKTLKQPVFTKNRKKVKVSLNLEFLLHERKFFIENFKKKLLIKTRVLMTVKGGYVSVYFGVPAFIGRSASFYYQRSYKSWFLASCSYYGLLSYFSLIGIKKKR